MAAGMLLNTLITSSVVSSTNPKLRVNAKGPLALSIALKTSQQLYAASRIETKFKPVLTSLAGRLNSQVELAIVNALGGGQIKAGKGGFYPDFFLNTGPDAWELREQKLVATRETAQGVVRKDAVGLAGGSGITIRSGKQDILTGFITEDGKPEAVIQKDVLTTRFVNQLKANKDDPSNLLKVLGGKGQAARAFKKTMLAKASAIDIPVQFQGKLENRTIKFTWAEIQKCVNSGKMRISVKVIDDDTIKLNLYFTGGTITKALNDMQKVVVKELNTQIGTEILKAMSEMSELPMGSTQKELEKFLKNMGFTHALDYIAGSAIISRGIVKQKKPKQKSEAAIKSQKFLSGVQWTALVQNQLKRSMKRSGPPRAPNLVERSGRFRTSVRIVPNYRQQLIKYYYLPLYSHLQDYGYEPDQQIIRSIREVAQKAYSTKFNIQRM
jgi:hypothetical protein